MPTFDLENHKRERGFRATRRVMDGRKECVGDYGVFFRNKLQSPNPCMSCKSYKECLSWEETITGNAKDDGRECFTDYKYFNSGHESQPCDVCIVNQHCCAVAIDMRAIADGKTPFFGEAGEMPFANPKPIATATVTPKIIRTAAAASSTSTSTSTSTVTSTSASTSNYCFPVTLETLRSFSQSVTKHSDEKLLLMLSNISFKADPITGKLASYDEARKSICLLSTVLNLRQTVAPRFRQMRRPEKAKGLSTQESELSRDRQLIDLHWLWCAGHKAVGKEFKPIFQDAFDFDKAGEFVILIWKAQSKSDALRLTDHQQIALSAIQSRKLADQWRSLVREENRLRVKLNTAASDPRSRVKAEDIDDYYESLVSLKLASGRATPATEVYRWKTGKTISQQKMSGRAKWLKAKCLL